MVIKILQWLFKEFFHKGMPNLPNWNKEIIEEAAIKINSDEVKTVIEDSNNRANIPLYVKPLVNAKVTSSYGSRTLTYDGVKHKDYHYGVDLVDVSGDIVAPEDCVIKKIIVPDLSYPCKFKWTKTGFVRATPPIGKKWEDSSWGWTPYFITIGVHSKTQYIFRHSVCTCSVGNEVKVGIKIGRYGNLGFSMGAHLHFETWPYTEIKVKGTNWPYTTDPIKFQKEKGVA